MASARTRNGTLSPSAAYCAPSKWVPPAASPPRRVPPRPDRYTAASSAAAPARVRKWNRPSESRLAADSTTAAGAGRRNASGSVVARPSTLYSTPSPRNRAAWFWVAEAGVACAATAARANASMTAASPSSPVATASPFRAAPIRSTRPAHLACQSAVRLTLSIVLAGQGVRVPLARHPGIPCTGDRRWCRSLRPATRKTAPGRDDQLGRRCLACLAWNQPSK